MHVMLLRVIHSLGFVGFGATLSRLLLNTLCMSESLSVYLFGTPFRIHWCIVYMTTCTHPEVGPGVVVLAARIHWFTVSMTTHSKVGPGVIVLAAGIHWFTMSMTTHSKVGPGVIVLAAWINRSKWILSFA